MLGRTTLLSILLAGVAAAADISGAQALEFTRHAVSFGPRPPGSPADTALQNYILGELRLRGCEVIEDAFTGQTPRGPIAMKNIIAKFPGKSGRAIAITGHFDTKFFPGRKFVGADDGGSSTGMLLEFARALAHQPRVDDVYLVFFDGEEAFGEWTDTDSLYGSRHLADKWRKDGTLTKLKALINVDMVGDKNLSINPEMLSNAGLRKLFQQTATELGYQAYFSGQQVSEEDDHLPFVKLGAPAIDIIDIEYPPWHTDGDTMDKVSARSLEIVGTVVLEVVHRLEHQ